MKKNKSSTVLSIPKKKGHPEHGDSLEKPISNHPSHSYKDARTHAHTHSLHEMINIINSIFTYVYFFFIYLVLILMTCESIEIGICVCVIHNPVSSTLFAWKSIYLSISFEK